MSAVSAPKFADWPEARRFRAYALAQQGWSQTAIAEALGVSQPAVSQWLAKARAQGVEALRTHKPPGRVAKLTPAQRAELTGLLQQGAEAHGFAGDVWTSPRVQQVIRRQFGVTYCDRQVRRILRRLQWTRQKPATRATQRDEAAIARWRRVRWRRLKKGHAAPSARSSSSMNPGSTRSRPS